MFFRDKESNFSSLVQIMKFPPQTAVALDYFQQDSLFFLVAMLILFIIFIHAGLWCLQVREQVRCQC